MSVERAANTIGAARALLVTSGAGMGVDSGLPDFRGNRGFWRAYPLYERLGLDFVNAANPRHFSQDPEFAWGFYAHRLELYRNTTPHEGFGILKRWIETRGLDHFIATSNIDGHFQRASFDEERVLEVHGSIHHLQCLSCHQLGTWPNAEDVPVDLDTMRALHVPTCPACGSVARPNVLMFGDWSWSATRTEAQERRLAEFLDRVRGEPLAIVELGAGTAVPTIRHLSERIAGALDGATLVRVNPREPRVPPGGVGIDDGALASLRQIDALMTK